ncbi:MAG: methionine--tRNA ligase [Parcubacteria group bacterium]
MPDKFYITTTTPYVNAAMHVGHALEFIQADAIARYNRLLGKEVVFNTGTDEHGLKIYRKALEKKKSPKKYTDEYAKKFKYVIDTLNVSYTHLIRTTDKHHEKAAQEFWKLCDKNGDIYKKEYKVKYCVGCELEKTDSELKNGCCPIHPNLKIEIIEEENYFFKFSNYQDKLLKLYKDHPDFVIPDFRLKEITNFVKYGLNDFSISRLKKKMPWGIPVPGDKDHVMYVWFDALVNYISTLGWPENKKNFNKFWPGFQIAGKDNLRQQTAIWQAMLMSAGLPTSKQVMIHGFINMKGQKISKSLGNVIDPVILAKKYGVDALRYWLLREINPFEDGDFTIERFEERHTSDLANNLGNLVSRISKLIDSKMGKELVFKQKFMHKRVMDEIEKTHTIYHRKMEKLKLNEALSAIWSLLTFSNAYIDEKKPWETVESDPNEFITTMTSMTRLLLEVSNLIEPFMPETSKKIKKMFDVKKQIKKWEGTRFVVNNIKPLFPRIK